MENTFAVGPDGSIYPCYRFVGMPEYVMGNVRDHPSQEDLASSRQPGVCASSRSTWTGNARAANISGTAGAAAYNAIALNNVQ